MTFKEEENHLPYSMSVLEPNSVPAQLASEPDRIKTLKGYCPESSGAAPRCPGSRPHNPGTNKNIDAALIVY